MDDDELWNLMDKANINEEIIKCNNCDSSEFIKDDNLVTCLNCHNIIDNVINFPIKILYIKV